MRECKPAIETMMKVTVLNYYLTNASLQFGLVRIEVLCPFVELIFGATISFFNELVTVARALRLEVVKTYVDAFADAYPARNRVCRSDAFLVERACFLLLPFSVLNAAGIIIRAMFLEEHFDLLAPT